MAKRGWLLGGLVAAVVVVAVLVPAAAARPSGRVHLWMVPLRKSSLGSAARGLELSTDSGKGLVEAEGEHSFDSPDIGYEAAGYSLDYGDAESGQPGVDSVWTGVSEYKNASQAKRVFRRWQTSDARFSELNNSGLSVTNALLAVPAVGSARFADLTTYRASNIAPFSSVDEEIMDGRYLLHVNVAARTAVQAKALAPRFAAKLDSRLKLAIAGRLQAKPVRLPAKPKLGAPVGGPDLAAMGLKTTDLGGQATYLSNEYIDPPWVDKPASDFLALSYYWVQMQPAGPFYWLQQEMTWFRTANEASFYADQNIALAAHVAASAAVPIDMSSVGDGAKGLYYPGQGGSGAFIVLSKGKLFEFIALQSRSAMPASEITSLAQTAADKVNAVLS